MPLVNQIRHSSSISSFHSRIEVNSQKSDLVTKLNHYLASHLSEPRLDVAHLLRTLCTSRASLHRKLVACTGMSTTEYVCYFRLQQATALLEQESDLSIFEISITVGFNSQSYFTKRFKEIVGCCPSKYRNSKCRLRHA